LATETENYYQFVRYNLIENIPTGAHRVLEVGCAEGATCRALKEKGCASELIGIELDPDAAGVARGRMDYVLCGDLEVLELEEPWFTEGSFDFILCGDVLEHLRDPWKQLDRLVKLIKPGGQLIVSLPNIRCYWVTAPLIFKDEWTYASAGILDSTHLRFFTKTTAMEMLEKSGLVDITVKPVINRRRDKLVKVLSLGSLTPLLASQWVLTGSKP